MIIKYYEPIDGVWYDITGNTGDTLTLGVDGWNTSAGGGGGTASWGSISGTITDQKDLTDYLQTNYITSSGYIDAVKIGTGVVNNTEFNYLDGVSGAIQTQLNGKLNKNTAITGDTRTKITYDSNGLVTAGTDITASDIPSGISAIKISSGLVDNTEFDYLNNVTGNIQTQLNSKLNTSNFESQLILGYQSLGSTIKGTLLGAPNPQLATNTGGLTNGRITYEAVYISKSETITGVKFYQATAGVYTGNNYNGVALYSYSGGTLTLVASSTNDINFWTGSGWLSKPFSSTYSASAGIYFVAEVYSRSAESSQPGLAQLTLNATFSVMDFTNGAKLVGYNGSITSLPSTSTISGTTTGTSCIGLYLY
jgi:hypothetical protein